MPKIVSYIICFLLVYFYIFAPPFQVVPLGLDKPILAWAFIYISYKKEWVRMYRLFKIELQFLGVIFCLSTLIFLMTRIDKTMVMYDLALLLEVIPCAYAIYRYVEQKNGFKLDQLIINSAVVAAFISLFLILYPAVAYYFKTELLKYPEGLADRLLFRGYGLSDGLLFSYPVIEGICMGLIIFGFYRNPIYYLFLLPMLVAIFTNARSGLVPVMVAIITLLIFRTKWFMKLGTAIVVAGMLLVSSLAIVIEQNEMLKGAYEWGMTSFDIMGDLLEGKKTENVEILLSDDMQVYPESIDQWIIGSGEYIFTNERRSTDIGYFLRLNYGGAVYLALFGIMTVYMFVRLKRTNLLLALLLIVPVLYYHLKSDFFVLTPSVRFYFLIYLIAVLNPTSFKRSERLPDKSNLISDLN